MTILDADEDHRKVYRAISDVLHLMLESPHGQYPHEDAPVVRSVYVSAWGCKCKVSVIAEWDDRDEEQGRPTAHGSEPGGASHGGTLPDSTE